MPPGQEQALAPADDLVADAHTHLFIANTEALADPEIEQTRLEAQVRGRIGRQARGLAHRGRIGADDVRHIGGRPVAQPVGTRHEGDLLVGQLEQQFVVALQVGREGIALGVIEVALIAQAGAQGQIAPRRPRPRGTADQQRSIGRPGAHAGAQRDVGVEAALQRAVAKGEGLGLQRTHRRGRQRDKAQLVHHSSCHEVSCSLEAHARRHRALSSDARGSGSASPLGVPP